MNATDEQAGVRPTIVLVHGAFADASSWNGVIQRLQQQGYTVIAAANPLRGLAADSAYTASLLDQIDGPVLLVGHSYAGAVITTAATSTPNVVGLVYIAAFATDDGENLDDVESGSEDSILGTALMQYHYPSGPGGETAVELAARPGMRSTGASSASSSGGSPRRSGFSTTPRSRSARPPSITPITSRS